MWKGLVYERGPITQWHIPPEGVLGGETSECRPSTQSVVGDFQDNAKHLWAGALFVGHVYTLSHEPHSVQLAAEDEVFRYYGTFTRTLLTMFEILFANWGPPCRVLIENFSEWFSVFFLLYLGSAQGSFYF